MSQSPLTSINVSQHESKKRKRGADAACEGLGNTFAIHPCPSSGYDTPRIFTPVSLIPRSRLPLSCLDLCANSLDSSNRLFSACIPCLEKSSEKDDHGARAYVLVARLQKDDSLFAVEEVQNGVYALCKLGDWVREGDIVRHGKWQPAPKQRHPVLERRPAPPNPTEWWRSAMIKDVAPGTRKGEQSQLSKLVTQPSPRILGAEGVPSQKLAELARPKLQEHQAIQNIPSIAPEPFEEPLLRSSSADEIYLNIIKKYLDTLYISKTSLAYFAKGPLSRARVAFTIGETENMQLHDLSSFLRQCLLTKSMEKKYRDKLPELVNKVMMEAPQDSLERQTGPKKRKSKKLKPSADGIFPEEEEHIRKWWHAPEIADTGITSLGTRDVEIKRRTAELRIRETQMQLILAMEVLALETSLALSEPKDGETQAEAQLSQPGQAQSKRKPNSKKHKDLGVFLDLLVDRLCIWQSLWQDDHLDNAISDKKGGQDDASRTQSEKTSNDALKAFCIEVIIPFYLSRTPKQATSINKKLGGPSAPSPVKRTSKAQATSRKSGEPAARSKPAKPERRPLNRVTSETLNQTTKRAAIAPSLIRSATDSGILPLCIKREPSEVPSLSSIPARESSIPTTAIRPLTSRSNLSSTNMKRFSQREVDLDAMTSANQAKLRRKAEIERKLQEAISTLKKPRRDVIGREVVEEAEERRKRTGGAGGGGVGTTAMSKNADARHRSNLQGVQVTATPKRGRKSRDVVMVTPHRGWKTGASSFRTRSLEEEEGEEAHSDLLSSSFVPSTAVKSGGELVVRDTGHRIPDTARALMDRRMNDGVVETPSRGPAKWVSFFTSANGTTDRNKALGAKDASDMRFHTPLKPLTREAAAAAPVENGSTTPLSTTPLSTTKIVASLGTEEPKCNDVGAEKSLYDALGWNDDPDDLA